MEDPQIQPQPATYEEPLGSRKPTKRRAFIILAIIVALLGTGLILWLTQGSKQSDTEASKPLSAIEKVFYDMLAVAAAKKTVHFTYAERKFASLQARDSNTISSDAYSVAETDDDTGDFRAVYANRIGSSQLPYYDVGRCLDGKTYAPAVLLTIKNLRLAEDTLKQPLDALPADSARRTDGCQLESISRAARLTDGVIPIGLDSGQIAGWQQHLQASKFIRLKDEGRTTYQGTAVRKVHLTTESLGGAGNFYESARNGARLELIQPESNEPGAEAYRLDDIPMTDNIEGFYLIDETTNLPVYSEFTTASLLNGKEGYVFKQAYRYPETLSIGPASTLDVLQ